MYTCVYNNHSQYRYYNTINKLDTWHQLIRNDDGFEIEAD